MAAALVAAGCGSHDTAKLEIDAAPTAGLAQPLAVGVQVSKNNGGGPRREVRLRQGSTPVLTLAGRGRYSLAAITHNCAGACMPPIKPTAADHFYASCTTHVVVSRDALVRLLIAVDPRSGSCSISGG
jgi:hypothetical protein